MGAGSEGAGQAALPMPPQVEATKEAREARNDRAGLDQETRLMLLCYSMLNILDQRMSDQMDVMQARNRRAAELKNIIADANALAAKFPPDPKASDTLGSTEKESAEYKALEALQKRLEDAGLSGFEDLVKAKEKAKSTDADGLKVKKGDLDAAISKLTGMMDSDATIQQLEMFTLQSVFSKRNEIFELMSNAMKKCQDTKSTLVRNF